MAGQKGRDVLLKLADETGAFITVAGIRTKTLLLSAGTVDGTNTDSPDFGEIEGPFQISELAYSGEHDGEASFTLTLESAGALSFRVSS